MKRILWIGLFVFFALLFGCSSAPKRFETVFYDAFDTVTQVTVFETDASVAQNRFDAVHESLLFYHRLFDIYHEYEGITNLATLNRTATDAPVHVDAVLYDFLYYAKEMETLTGGRMNPAMGSVLSLWHDAREAGLADPENAVLPEMNRVREAALHMKIDDLVLDETVSTVYFADPALRLDVGAVAKGYAVQRTIEKLKADGARSMLISAGGNVAALGIRGDGKDWKVGVQSPDGTSLECAVCVNEKSLVTSGTYQRYYTVDGRRYHHIIDPETLMPSERFSSVTVLSEDSGLADALSTALFNMDLAEGQALIGSLPETEALWIMSDGETMQSEGFPAENIED